MAERRRALIVANSDYVDLAFRRLTAPVHDARELARVLSNPSIGAFEVETLLDEKSGVVNQAIEDFFVFSDPKPDDFLLLYFSGHGITDEEGQLYLATNDTQLVRQSIRRVTAVGADFVNTTMRRSRARRQVLLLDCCHSGAFAEAMSVKGQALPGVETHFQGKGRIVLTASTGTQFSFEGQTSDGVQPSIYTRLLVRALETGEADRDCNGQIDLDELHDYLVEQVRAEAPQQTPTKSGYLEGQLFIARTSVVRAATLPVYLQNAIAASENLTRFGAVYALKELLDDPNPGMALAARQALEALRDKDDSMKVQAAARDCLASRQFMMPAAPPEQAPTAAADEIARRAVEARAAEIAERQRKKEEEKRQNLIRQKEVAAHKAAAIAEAERKEKEEEEQDRIARERAEAQRIKKQKAEQWQQQLIREKAEAEKIAQEKAERKRQERQTAESARKEKLAKEEAERRRLEREEADSTRKAESLAGSGSAGQPIAESRLAQTSSHSMGRGIGVAAVIAIVGFGVWFAAHNRSKVPLETAPATTGTATESQQQAGTTTPASSSQPSLPLDQQNPTAAPITKVDMDLKSTLTDPDSSLQTQSIAFTPGNRGVLAAAMALPHFKGNGVIRLWDLTTGQLMRTLQSPGADRPGDQFETLTLSPDGRFAAVTTYGMNSQKPDLLLWDLNTGKLVRDFGESTKLSFGTEAVTFSPDSTMIVLGAGDGTAYVWNTQTGELIQSLKHPNIIASLAFSTDGGVLAVGDRAWNPSVRLWNTRTWARARDLSPTQTSYAEAVAFSPDGKTLATGHYRGGIYLWDYRTGALLRTLRAKSTENGGSRTLAFNSTGEILSFVCDGNLQFWNPSTGKLLNTYNTNASALALAFHPGKLFATASEQENAIQLWQFRY